MRITKDRIYMLNKCAEGRKRMTKKLDETLRMTKKLDETLISFFDWLADVIEPDFTIIVNNHELRLFSDWLKRANYWTLDTRYINIPVPFGTEIDPATPMRRRITREQALWLATNLSAIMDEIEEVLTKDTEQAERSIKEARGIKNDRKKK